MGISVTKRFAACTAAGIPLTLAAWFIGLYVYVFVFYLILLFALFILDYLRLPKGRFLSVQREEDKLYFKEENEIYFYVQNNSKLTLHIQAKDEIPNLHFQIIREQVSQTVPPGKRLAFSYTVIPAKRGCFLFENMYLRYSGFMGLCVKYIKIPCPTDYKVYPNVRDLSKYRLMTQKNRLLPQGEKPIRFFGTGEEFESLRAYVEGDDYRRMNWQATARENRLIVNQYQTERNQPVYILLDTGRPMSYVTKGYKKLDYAINAALILSDIVNQQGDNSGLLVFDAKIQAHILPGKGAVHRNLLMETLYRAEDNRLTADYEGAFRQLCERQKRRSLVFIFTDFEILEEAEQLIAHIALLKRRHMPMVVFMENESLKTLIEKPVFNKKDRVLRETAEEFMTERRQIFKQLNALRIPNAESKAENFAVSAVNRYLMIKNIL